MDGGVDLRGEMTLVTGTPAPFRPTGPLKCVVLKVQRPTHMKACQDQVSCEAAARRPSGRRPGIMVMGFGCVCGAGAFQPSPTDTRTGMVLKIRNLKLAKPLMIASLSKSLRGIVTSWCLRRLEGREKKTH